MDGSGGKQSYIPPDDLSSVYTDARHWLVVRIRPCTKIGWPAGVDAGVCFSRGDLQADAARLSLAGGDWNGLAGSTVDGVGWAWQGIPPGFREQQ